MRLLIAASLVVLIPVVALGQQPPATAATASFISLGPIAPMQPTRKVSSWVSLPG